MKEELFPLIMEPPLFVDDLIVELEIKIMFAKTKEERKMAKVMLNRYQIQKQASQIRKLYD